jgi:hypothetical protein
MLQLVDQTQQRLLLLLEPVELGAHLHEFALHARGWRLRDLCAR